MFLFETVQKTCFLEDPGLEEGEGIKIVLTQMESAMEWLQLAQNRHEWRILMNTVMNLQISYNVGNLLTDWGVVG